LAVSQPLTPEPDRLTSEEAGLVPQLLNPEQVGAVTGQHPKTILAAFNRGDLAGNTARSSHRPFPSRRRPVVHRRPSHVGGGPVIRLLNTDDIREDLELAVLELQDRFGVAPSSIRRYVNSAIKAKEDADGIRAINFLRQRWARLQDQSAEGSRPIGNDATSPRTVAEAEAGGV